MDKIKKSKMKIIFAKNAFGGHYEKIILSEERLFRK